MNKEKRLWIMEFTNIMSDYAQKHQSPYAIACISEDILKCARVYARCSTDLCNSNKNREQNEKKRDKALLKAQTLIELNSINVKIDAESLYMKVYYKDSYCKDILKEMVIPHNM